MHVPGILFFYIGHECPNHFIAIACAATASAVVSSWLVREFLETTVASLLP
ncbi:hypothetical protein AG1IA_07700 [Rhizoctonia solani AG-1 IA]|uniref:Uncharacterized protein n=1 Tax=Thanatephorus cucumeris (strain AG1-IA) TaxID=983506 RepID=L8WPM7_THACA|nr:hypothetical protein AG1IA_07700 [Rhizoctonia solani AG-1 IA]